MTVVDTDLSTIEHLDFEFHVPCEHNPCSGPWPAVYIVARLVPCCAVNEYFCCRNCWMRMGMAARLVCMECKQPLGHRDEILKIIRVLEG